MSEDIRARISAIVTSPRLGYRQRVHQLALLAEAQLPYPKLSAEADQAMESGLVTDLFEGPAPYRPRYLLPDYAHALANGSEHLELEAPRDLEEAVDFLISSITTYLRSRCTRCGSAISTTCFFRISTTDGTTSDSTVS